MDKNVLARNLLILAQLDELLAPLKERGIPVILLKGVALIVTVPEYAGERLMDDIDLLIPQARLKEARTVLSSLGYTPVPEDPCALRHPAKTAPVDIAGRLWYLDGRENDRIFEECVPVKGREKEFPSPALLAPVDAYIHTFAHAAVHHGIKMQKWLRDIELIRERRGEEIDKKALEDKLRHYGLAPFHDIFFGGGIAPHPWSRPFYRRLLSHPVPGKGHVLRFLALPFKKKPSYLWETLFPPEDFLRDRYLLTGKSRTRFYRILRPVFLFAQLLMFSAHTVVRMAAIWHRGRQTIRQD